MKEVRDNLVGMQVISEPYELWGKVTGDVRVMEGAKFYMRGTIYGDLLVEWGGRVHIYGHVNGNLTVFRGAKVIHSGVISGNATNQGGRLFIDRDGQVLGKVKTKSGDTTFQPKDDIPDEYK
jgi:cytoskeletal protein CcmA (bactofilin family)